VRLADSYVQARPEKADQKPVQQARYCFGAGAGFAAGAVVSPGVVFLGLLFDFFFFFGVLGAPGAWSL